MSSPAADPSREGSDTSTSISAVSPSALPANVWHLTVQGPAESLTFSSTHLSSPYLMRSTTAFRESSKH